MPKLEPEHVVRVYKVPEAELRSKLGFGSFKIRNISKTNGDFTIETQQDM